ncbi:hypothetical protein F896_01196 [Acinetobacter genomosp. 15BJ]|uniref:Uncharacterized protein n=1 Tax=Acinetobacter genomosp. 15BJ TaxID=106651 RepID=R9B2Z8_9GAMM|nr:hypothetical protein [Acinetobacter genomosp. 15BJ]EOR08670.1 hypothetical protein F896_01196 [Acinetobacter genomosp. 15BJ]
MAELPTADQFIDPSTTEAQFKNALKLLVENVASVDLVNQRAERSSYLLSGFIIKQRVVASEAVEIAFTDLTIAKGAGNGGARVAGGTYTLAAGQAIYVDLDSAPVNNRLIPQLTVTSGDMGYLSLAEGKDAFLKGRKILLFINDLYGYGGLLFGHYRHTARPVGDIWLKNGTNRVYFDASTRTLSWSGTFFLPNRGLNRRYRLEAGSVTFSGGGLQTAYIDLNLADAGGNIPKEAVKVGIYTGGATTESFENLANQLPFYIYNTSLDGEHYPVGGFPKPTIVNLDIPYNNLDDNDVVVFVGASAIDIYMKGSKRLSTKYTDWRIARQTAPFDPNNQLGNVDVWRIQGVYEVDKPQSSFGFTRTREIVTAGEMECAILEDGKGDFMGGWHGDEILTSFMFMVDGKPIDPSVSKSFVCKKFELIQVSDMFRMNTQIKVADHTKHLIFENRKLRLKQYVKWVMSLIIKTAYLTMLPIKRKQNDTSGEQITDKAIREPLYAIENIGEADFERTLTMGSLPACQIWGPTGIDASVEFLKHPNNPTACFYIANPTNYNKFYYSVAGNFIGTERHTTAIGEVWETDSIISVNSSL